MAEMLTELLQAADIPDVDDAFVFSVLRKLDMENRRAKDRRLLVLMAAPILATGGALTLYSTMPGASLDEMLRLTTAMIQALTGLGCITVLLRTFRIAPA